MLNRTPLQPMKAMRTQQGVVLMISLIMLVALTLAGIGLMRSVDTTNIIAGNLAFKQSATNSGDLGTEAAIAWLQANNSGTTLHTTNSAKPGYSAIRGNNVGTTQTWDAFWTSELAPLVPFVMPHGSAWNATGNDVSYVIQRLCNAPGDPVSTGVDCSTPQTSNSSGGSSKGSGVVALNFNNQVYYRITSRIVGPRNTVSYIQTVIAL